MTAKPVAFVDVDGTLTVRIESKKCDELGTKVSGPAVFVRDVSIADDIQVHAAMIPTARESWDPKRQGEVIFLRVAEEAKACLEVLEIEGLDIVILTALPPWAAARAVERTGFNGRHSILAWKESDPHKLAAAEAHAMGRRWVVLDDRLIGDAADYRELTSAPVIDVDGEHGLSLGNAYDAIRLLRDDGYWSSRSVGEKLGPSL